MAAKSIGAGNSSNVDAILQRLMPSGKAPGDLACSPVKPDERSPTKQNNPTGLLCSFDDTDGDVTDFFIPNSSFNDNGNSNDVNNNNFPPSKSSYSAHKTRRTSQMARMMNYHRPESYECAPDLSMMSYLTEHIIALLQSSRSGYVDLESATKDMDTMQKRKVLDIISVLEGLDIVESPVTNIVKWKGNLLLSREEEERVEKLQCDITEIKEQEFELDERIRWLKQSFLNVCEDKNNNDYAYTSHEDVSGFFPDLLNIAIHVPTSAAIDSNIIGNTNFKENLIYELIVKSKSVLPKVQVLSVDGQSPYIVEATE